MRRAEKPPSRIDGGMLFGRVVSRSDRMPSPREGDEGRGRRGEEVNVELEVEVVDVSCEGAPLR